MRRTIHRSVWFVRHFVKARTTPHSKNIHLPVRQPQPRAFAGEGQLFRQSAQALYIHVPFCYHKCHYCDFYSIVDTRDRQEAFAERLERELEALAGLAQHSIRTIFVGGGTPSLLRVDLWRSLLRRLDELFGVRSLIADPAAEFTVECNPETVTAELMDVLAAGGVSRVSMGAQSFNPRHLKTLERWHTPENVAIALDLARAAGISRVSIDLIFGVPGQTLADWQSDVRTALALGTSHLSCYGLTYEQGTAMTARMERGEFQPLDEDTEADMFEETLALLASHGLSRYEISNFARAGEECRHNLLYWRQGNWLAAGPSASGHLGGLRWKNMARLDDYLTHSNQGFSPVAEVELPNPRRNLTELLMTTLRLAEGIELARLYAIADAIDPSITARLESWRNSAMASEEVEADSQRLRLSARGLRVANTLILQAAQAVDPS